MLITIRNNSIALSDGTTKNIIPSLTVQEFSKETDILYNASGVSQGSERPDENWVISFGQRLFKRRKLSEAREERFAGRRRELVDIAKALQSRL